MTKERRKEMNDRFKFRCGITITHYDDDGDDIETLLLVNNISIFDDGDVGFNREFLKESVKEAVKRENLSEEEERTLWNSLDEYEVFDEWYQMPADFIEQCTGLKDKNGKLIYEGDIIEHKILPDKPRRYIVKWSYKDLCFELQSIKNPLFYDVFIPAYDDLIGNIHENPELLKESK